MKKTITILLLAFLIQSCNKTWTAKTVDGHNITIENKGSTQISSIAKLIEPYKTQLDRDMNVIVGNCVEKISKNRFESKLGNWFTDAVFVQAEKMFKQDLAFAVQNYGGIRVPEIPEGPVTKGKIFEVMPFENRVVAVELDYKSLKDLFEVMARHQGWPISKQVSYEIHNYKPEKIKINGKALDKKMKYWVVMPDYIANGGDKCDFLLHLNKMETSVLIRDVLLDYLKENPEIAPQLTNRVLKVDN